MKKLIAYKKSILSSIGFLFFTAFSNAQDSAAIIHLLMVKEFAQAKEAVDKQVSDNSTAVNLVLKAVVYDSLAKNPAAHGLSASPRDESFAALQQVAGIDEDYILRNTEALAKDLYAGFVFEGMSYFNNAAERKDKSSFAKALETFKSAAVAGRFLYKYKWAESELNPALLTYLSKAAIYADKEEDAIFYSKKIVDEKDTNQQQRSNYEIVYQWLIYYFNNRKDTAAVSKYLAVAKQLYPQSTYFLLTEIDWLRQKQDYSTLFERYRVLIEKEPTNNRYKLAYARDIFNSLWPNKLDGGRPAAELIAVLEYLAGKAETATEASMLLAKAYINMAKQYASNKNIYKSFLELSNRYLRKISSNKTGAGVAERKEARQLLVINSRALSRMKEK